MFVITKLGAYWVAEHRERRHHVLIRARRREHLEALRPLAKNFIDETLVIRSTPEADFPFRTEITRHLWSNMMLTLCMNIDYPSFKHAVADEHGYLSPYYRFLVKAWEASIDCEAARREVPGHDVTLWTGQVEEREL